MPWSSALRVTARIAAFMPGASPPLVRTAMCFIRPRLCRCAPAIHGGKKSATSRPRANQGSNEEIAVRHYRFTINRFDLGDGPDPGIVNSQNDCDQISFRGLPCSEAPLKEKLMSLAERLDTIRQGADKRIPPDKRAIMHRATDDLRASGILSGVIKVGDPLPPFALKNAFGQEIGSSELLANGKLVLTVFRGSW